ncbi:putative beta-lactamase transpeptidase-like protein [Lyophyllum shimeji]|uniref:Beta-lactamase transpeptidase-like protein n=1 Tax=Lyophyllum shimeji TaxID=47721 RepID=A0A9P3PR06_LYOSH|nr:putative beta-lactamase transpeptidase-like protein [Lyophyllum shimeji]
MVNLTTQLKDRLQSIISEAVESKRTPGLVFGVATLDGEQFFAHAGDRVFGEPSAGPIGEDSVMWICSQTKMLASIATFQLVEAGKLRLDDVAAKYLPELANPVVLDKDPQLKQPSFRQPQTEITVRHLLNHSSGLDYGHKDRICEYHLPTVYTTAHEKLDPVRRFYELRRGLYPTQLLKFEPGTSFAYSYGPDSLGFIIERITGQSLEEYYKEHIFSPLGITSASFYLTPNLKQKSVPLVFRESDGKIVPWASQVPIIVQDPEQVHLHMSGVGLYCSMKDYLTILQHLLQIRAGTAVNPILSKASLDTFFQPTLTPLGVEELNDWSGKRGHQYSTALALWTVDEPGRRRKGSAGWYGWANTEYFIDPETGVALVFGSQIVPRQDPEVMKVFEQLEEAFYRGLEA